MIDASTVAVLAWALAALITVEVIAYLVIF